MRVRWKRSSAPHIHRFLCISALRLEAIQALVSDAGDRLPDLPRHPEQSKTASPAQLIGISPHTECNSPFPRRDPATKLFDVGRASIFDSVNTRGKLLPELGMRQLVKYVSQLTPGVVFSRAILSGVGGGLLRPVLRRPLAECRQRRKCEGCGEDDSFAHLMISISNLCMAY
jgi:hypothetical protein